MCGTPLYFTGKCGIINCYCYTLGCGKGGRKARLAAFYIIYNNVRAMKRTGRKVGEATRKKIAEALRGKPKTAEHKQALSKAMMAYWATIPKEENEAER